AHELIVKAWTQEGPFRFEGTHYQHSVVNPWAVPLQQPHPRVWIPGVLSKETIIWAAQKGYPYIALSTEIEATKKIWETDDKAAQESGHAGGPEVRGYLQRCHIAETDEKAMENARQFMWMQGEFTGLAHPVWSSPSGYFSPSYRTAFVEYAVGRRSNPRGAAFEDQLRDQQIVAGAPKTVIPKLRRLLEETRPSILGFWTSDGFVSNEDAKSCIRCSARRCSRRSARWARSSASGALRGQCSGQHRLCEGADPGRGLRRTASALRRQGGTHHGCGERNRTGDCGDYRRRGRHGRRRGHRPGQARARGDRNQAVGRQGARAVRRRARSQAGRARSGRDRRRVRVHRHPGQRRRR